MDGALVFFFFCEFGLLISFHLHGIVVESFNRETFSYFFFSRLFFRIGRRFILDLCNRDETDHHTVLL